MRCVLLRRMLGPLFAGLFLVGCHPPVKPEPRPEPVKVAPPPSGDVLRLRDQAGAVARGKVTIRIENESFVGGKPKKGAPKTVRSFTLVEEHTVDSVDKDGTEHLSARLLEVQGQADGSAREQKDAAGLAQALQDIKISFNRTPRWEISELQVEGVGKPLDPTRARIVAGSIFGAGRGPMLPEERVKVGQAFSQIAVLPLPGGGKNMLKVDYLYKKNDGTSATISFEGTSSGETQGAQLLSEIKGEYRFDTDKGRLLSHMLDNQTTQGGESASGIVLRVHIEWEAQETSAAPAQPAATPAPAP